MHSEHTIVIDDEERPVPQVDITDKNYKLVSRSK